MAVGQKFLPLFLRSHVSLAPPVPDVNLRLILAKVHICLSVPFDSYWRPTRGEKVGYALKKNQLDLWATGFSCRLANSRSRAGKKINF